MKRILLIFIISLVFAAVQAQTDNPLKDGMPNTLTLSNSEVVYDLNGEWNSFVEAYGPWKVFGTHQSTIKITQMGRFLVGVLMKDAAYYSKGWESIRAELYKSGFKKVEMMTNHGTLDSKGHISDDGNKILIDDGEKRRMTLTRK